MAQTVVAANTQQKKKLRAEWTCKYIRIILPQIDRDHLGKPLWERRQKFGWFTQKKYSRGWSTNLDVFFSQKNKSINRPYNAGDTGTLYVFHAYMIHIEARIDYFLQTSKPHRSRHCKNGRDSAIFASSLLSFYRVGKPR